MRPPDGTSSRLHVSSLPKIDGQQVQRIIDEGLNRNNLQSRIQLLLIKTNPRIVLVGCRLQSILDGRPIVMSKSSLKMSSFVS